MYSYEKTYNKSAEELFGELHRKLKEKEMVILSYVDVKEIFSKMKEDIEPYYILDVCYPPAAVELIHENVDIGAFIPCKLILIQKGNTTKVLMPKPSVLSREYLDSDGKTVEKYENIIIGILEEL